MRLFTSPSEFTEFKKRVLIVKKKKRKAPLARPSHFSRAAEEGSCVWISCITTILQVRDGNVKESQ